ncbi:uncharacterized protein LOC126911949 [Spodoptera frugiperda]|uniref:Uncharacterized protein LOC126911448 n=1 Tax=Spodoptera frugiperda TaxID=7108 RepID=A0A9R0DVQ7_SPOFR|nr:uncharacterized protein LOC126911448 [Spodoptera frugiperda]XP_050557292.1 uncharacterized protein LOC126911949 [Spodoptera frugiperda]
MSTESAKSRDKSPMLLSVESADLVRELVRKRGIVKGRLTKFNNHLESLLKDDDISSKKRIDLKLRIQACASLLAEFNHIQTKIEERVADSELDAQLTQREIFEDDYYDSIARAESILNVDEFADCSGSCRNHSHNSNHNPSSVKLPVISMPTFDGSYEHWLEFRDTFTSLIHDSKDISTIQKFHYLKSSLKGDAELVIHSIEFSAKNYQVAWDLLLNRYNNSDLLIDNHLDALFSIPPITKESPSLIRKLIDNVLKNIRALVILGEPADTWDTLTIYLIVSKLDKVTKREWQAHKFRLSQLNENNSKSRLTLSDIIGFLRNTADVLDSLQRSHGKDVHNTENKKQHKKSHNTSHCNVSSEPDKTNDNRSKSCLKCNANHRIYKCKKFIESNLDSKLKLVRDHNLCENCLNSGHLVTECKFGPCRHCSQKHNSLLHNANSSVACHTSTNTEASTSGAPAHLPAPAPIAADSALSIQVNKAHMQTESTKSIGVQSVLLSTAIVEVADAHGTYHKARALLDNGSQRCFISKSLCQLLNSPLIQSTNEVRGVGDSVVHCTQACDIVVKSCVNNSFSTRIHCFVLSRITASMPAVCKLSANICIPDNIQLADPQFLDYKTIDILIGADRFWDLLEDGKIRLSSGPFLQNTKFGWIISGPIAIQTRKKAPIHCNIVNSLDTQLRLFWEIEDLPKVRDVQTDEERECEDHFVRTTTRGSDGRFCVHIPFRQSPESLGDSYTQAERRFLALEKRLQRSSDYKSLYSNFMQEYLSLGHMTQVDSYESPCYFMPHHGVFRELSTTTKLRVVFDASAPSSSGKSLNDLQLVGPPIQGDLIAILLRFRQHKYVACADVEKMYRQCLVDEGQRSLQMILWRDHPSKPLGIFKLNTVTYGTASAPFLSVRCLKQLANESPDADVARAIREDFYVDDFITGSDNKLLLLDLCDKTQKTLQLGCFPLRKWIYNFRRDDGSRSSSQFKPLSLDDNISSKTLGIGWHNLSDNFYFNTQIQIDNDKPISKRSILSKVSQIFDPLGLLSPVIIVVKVLLQQLWLQKIGWDDNVPDSTARVWNRFVISLQALNTIRIPRHVIGAHPKYIELHVFSDASQTAYGACIYIRTVNYDLTVTVRLLFSKSKVAPLKPISIPRLELCGALLGARLYDKVRDALRCSLSKIVFWTDSTIVLGWLHMRPNQLKTFVQNRVAEIHDLTLEVPWRHVRSENNPADLASRGVRLEELSSSRLWWEGPEFLCNPNFSIDDHKGPDSFKIRELPEVKSYVTAVVAQDSSESSLFPFHRFSQFKRMRRAAAFMLRFIHNSRYKNNRYVGSLSVDELHFADKTLARLCQFESYPVECKALCNNGSIKNKSCLSKLNVFLDDCKIMRVGGRLVNSNEFIYGKKHPIVISSKHYFATLLFRHEHIQLLHAAPQALLFHLRESWWPVGGRNLARQIVHNCVICTRIRGKTLTPMMGNLPAARVTPSLPFVRCGVDYAGPVLILNRKGKGARLIKGYICLFICFVTRAVHLELVSDLSSEAYLLTLKRFISRRGKPAEIYSDNGRNFVGIMNDFSKFLNNCSSDILEFAQSQNIKFHFIPPYSPHFGGLWEAGVKSSKYHLRRVIGNAHLTFEEYSTVLAQIEAVLNSRPLSPLSPDPQDLSPLTPGHFLIGRPLAAPACDDLRDVPASRLQRYQRVEQLRQHFWTRWAKEYISELQVRTKWRENKDELQPGSLVVIKDSNLPPLKWQLGRVLCTVPGKDGISRVADIQTSSGVLRRAFTNICPLLPEVDRDAATEDC